MKTIILAALSMAALSCASPTRQVVSPRGSDVDNWTDEATHDWRVKNWNAKVGNYGHATGTNTAHPFSRR
jgi:hypothetical protein